MKALEYIFYASMIALNLFVGHGVSLFIAGAFFYMLLKIIIEDAIEKWV